MAKRQYLSGCPQTAKVVERLIGAGWEFYHGGCHARMSSPDGKTKITVIRKASDWRAVKNWISQLRHTPGVPRHALEGL